MSKFKITKVKGAKCPKCKSEDWVMDENYGHDSEYHSIAAVCQECETVFEIIYKAYESSTKEKI